jgi:signal transduction histidine kinase/ActR/RegA family two-component response regulator
MSSCVAAQLPRTTEPENIEAGVTTRALTDRDLGRLAQHALRAGTLAIALLFLAIGIYTAVAPYGPYFLPGTRVRLVISHLVLVLISLVMYAVCRRLTLSLTKANAISAALSFTLTANLMLGALLGANPLFSFCIAILIIGSCGTLMSTAWACAIAIVEIAGWAVVADILFTPNELQQSLFVMAAGVSVAFIVHLSRKLAIARILELRDGDARRERALQQALAETDEARRGLDRKVEERTAALRNELEERERLEEQLRHAQKMEAVGRLAGGIAHDFNNLLTVIRMSLRAVGELAMSDDVRDALRDASESTDRAAGLTHDLLAFARKQTLERASVAVTEILGGVERMVRRVAEAGIRLEVRMASDVGDVIADRHQIEQVLLNLAINACDAMDNHGTLSVVVDTVELAASEAALYRMSAGTYVRFAVTDTGTGMDAETAQSVFEPFFTTKAVGRGTGLGLAVAHGIVTQHGGQIDVKTELGRGSTFTMFLPRARRATPSPVIALARPQAAPGHETLLVVEDEPAVRRAVQRNLERLGYQVLAAHDGEDALRLVEAREGIDLLLSDVVMPGIDGPELACRLRARWNDLPVLFVTGYSADRLARTDAVGPHDRVLEKPYQFDELARTIRGMLEAHVARRATGASRPVAM